MGGLTEREAVLELPGRVRRMAVVAARYMDWPELQWRAFLADQVGDVDGADAYRLATWIVEGDRGVA